MKHNRLSQNKKHKPANASRPIATADLNPSKDDFAPPAGEVAIRAYFSYVNQGSLPGHDVQHWLEAEVQVLAEHNLTRAHGFHNRA
jgi:hypothetical protein